MKKSLFRVLSLLAIILFAFVCVSCPGPETPTPDVPDVPEEPQNTVTLTFKSMPYDADGLYAKIKPYDLNGDKLETINLGKITKAVEDYSVALPEGTVEFYAVLSSSVQDSSTYDKYSIHVDCSAGFADEYIFDGYWRIEKYSNHAPLYALSADYLNLTALTLGTPLELDFENAPFFFFSINNAQGKQYIVNYTIKNAEIYYSSNLDEMLKQAASMTKLDSWFSISHTDEKTTEVCDGDTLYILVRPYTYDFTNYPSEVSITVSAPPEMQDDYLPATGIREAVAISDSEILFSASSISVLSAVPKNLYLFDTAEKKVMLLKECDSEVGFLTEFGNGVLFAEGSKIWYFDKATKAITAKCVASNTIAGMCMAGDELFVLCGGQTAEMYETTGWTITKTSITFPGFYAAASLVYIPEKDRVFYITKGISPVDIYDAWYDSAQGKIVNTVSGSPYHGTYTMSVPLKRYGNENALITGDGKVFTVEGDVERVSSSALSYYTISEGSPYLSVDTSKSLGMSFVDIEFTDDYFYTLTNYDDKCIVRKFSMTDRLNAVKEYTLAGQKGSDIVVGTDGVQVLSVSLERKFWDSTGNYYQVTATQLDLNLALKN